VIDIFLSASVPLPTRNRAFFESADVLSIREAVKGLVEIALPSGRITCGGHPAITPLLSLFIREAGLGPDSLTIYQSELFSGAMPKENDQFSDVRLVPAVDGDREKSLTAMRKEMVESRPFSAAVFVGGMEGLFEEFDLFVEAHPNARILPIASTGAAARMIFEAGKYPDDMKSELTYVSLFRRHLPPRI
jgi:hypothetical protein